MNESYEQELQTEINFLLHEVGYLQEEISNAREAATRTNTPACLGYSCPYRNSI